MRKVIIFVTLCLIGLSCFFEQKQCDDQGIWVKLFEDIPEGGYVLHNNQIYGCYVDSISDIKRVPPMENVDISSFEVCRGTGYARDKNHVYYPLKLVAVDGEDFGFTFFEEYVLKKKFLWDVICLDVNPKTFIYIGEGYAIDGNIMFRYGQRIKWNSNVLEKNYK